MDPLQALKDVFDNSLTVDEQYEALVNIQDWFMIGGFVPKDIPVEVMDQLLTMYRIEFEKSFAFTGLKIKK